MRPILWEIGPVRIHAYGFFLALAFLVATRLTTRLGKEQGISSDFVIDLALVACITSLIGARIALYRTRITGSSARSSVFPKVTILHGGLYLLWLALVLSPSGLTWQVAFWFSHMLWEPHRQIGCLLNCWLSNQLAFGLCGGFGRSTEASDSDLEAVLDVLLTPVYRRRDMTVSGHQLYQFYSFRFL